VCVRACVRAYVALAWLFVDAKIKVTWPLVISNMEPQALQVLGGDSSHSLQVVQWCKWIEFKGNCRGQRVTYNRYVLVKPVLSRACRPKFGNQPERSTQSRLI
jgi:hypothetical protein